MKTSFTLVLCALLAAVGLPVTGAVLPGASPVVSTDRGPVQGLVEGGIAAYKGIPYAAAPVGALRFKAPEPAPEWTAILDATGFGAPAMQSYDRELNGSELSIQLATVFTMRTEMKFDNEDCLYLNVWTPALDDAGAAKKRPVLVWFHGGGYAYGSGSWPVYDGANLARKGDVVVVTVNHRLNVFGYLHLADLEGGGAYADSGNAGMLDLIASLEWVRDNIGAFGGDAANVTIMGESGGGSKVSTLLAMPAADGLFHKAIIQSGPGLTGVPADAATQSARAVLAELGVAENDVSALAELSTEAIVAGYEAAQTKAGAGFMGLRMAPVVDGRNLPRHPFTPAAPAQSRDVPVLIGFNKDEWTIFNTGESWFGQLTEAELPQRAAAVVGAKADALLAAERGHHPDYTPTYLFNVLMSDARMLIGSTTLAERKAAQGGAPVFMYYLTWETPVGNGIFKSPHTLDMPLMFNNVDKAAALTGDSADARALENQMSSAWIAFARSGDPNNDTLPEWPRYDAATRPTMVFDVTPRVANDPKGDVRAILSGN
ncbi:MAG TPA: carboxylesterase/lipase family protein [Pseudomonadales bacterium]